MKFLISEKIKYGKIMDASLDNSVALDLMGKYALNEEGALFTPEAWTEYIRELIFPDDIMSMWTEFQMAFLPPTRGAR
jgi:hypothetical protein